MSTSHSHFAADSRTPPLRKPRGPYSLITPKYLPVKHSTLSRLIPTSFNVLAPPLWGTIVPGTQYSQANQQVSIPSRDYTTQSQLVPTGIINPQVERTRPLQAGLTLNPSPTLPIIQAELTGVVHSLMPKPHPYHLTYRKTRRPAAMYDPDIRRLQERCRVDGGDPVAIALLPIIFHAGISQPALMRQMTREEANEHCGGKLGQVYRTLLHIDDHERYHCRLCARDSDEGGWKQAKDALRHLKRDHFGLGYFCWGCNKLLYTKGELTSHHCHP